MHLNDFLINLFFLFSVSLRHVAVSGDWKNFFIRYACLVS